MKIENINPLIKVCFLHLLFILSNNCNAQYYRNDSLYNDPVWGKLDTLFDKDFKPIGLTGRQMNKDVFIKNDFAFFNLKRELLLKVFYRQDIERSGNGYGMNPMASALTNRTTSHWDFNFSSGNHVRITKVNNTAYITKNKLLKLIDKYKMFQGDRFNPEAEKKFIEDNGGNYIEPINADSADKTPYIEDNKILLDNKILGNFQVKYDQADSTKLISINIYNFIDGSKVAEALPPLGDSQEWTVTTFSDNKTQNLFYYSENNLEKLFTWLLKNKYLYLK